MHSCITIHIIQPTWCQLLRDQIMRSHPPARSLYKYMLLYQRDTELVTTRWDQIRTDVADLDICPTRTFVRKTSLMNNICDPNSDKCRRSGYLSDNDICPTAVISASDKCRPIVIIIRLSMSIKQAPLIASENIAKIGHFEQLMNGFV